MLVSDPAPHLPICLLPQSCIAVTTLTDAVPLETATNAFTVGRLKRATLTFLKCFGLVPLVIAQSILVHFLPSSFVS